MPGSIGPLEIAIVLIIALLVFGPKRLPEMGKSLGRGMREFKETVTGDKRSDDEHNDGVRKEIAARSEASESSAPAGSGAVPEQPATPTHG